MSEEEEKHRFDNVLNNGGFQKKREKGIKPLEALELQHKNIDWIKGDKDQTKSFAKKKGDKANVTPLGSRSNKENVEEKRLRKEEQREMKVTKKGKEMTLIYTDSRQIDQFCITNKLFGMDKDKIARAVAAGKGQLLL